MSLDPRSAAWLAMLHRIDAPRLHELPIEAARHSYNKLMYAYGGEPQAVDAVHELVMARREHEGGALAARLYRPLGTAPQAPLPVVLWLHGGGWVLGNLPGYDNWCRALANACGVAVLALDYRLSPEHRFPAAIDDAWFALGWLSREAAGLGLDAARISVAGDSAGATLAAALCLIARDAGASPIRQQTLIYPATDMLGQYASATLYGSGHFLENDALAWFAYNYLASEQERHDWRVSPLLAANHAGLPPALVINAECDPLAGQGAAYAKRLASCGVPVRHIEYAGMVHGFATMFKLFKQASAVPCEIAAALRAVGS